MTFQAKARMRRAKKSRNRAGIGEIGVLYPDNLGASWVRAMVPVKAPTKILFQGKSISNDMLIFTVKEHNRIYVQVQLSSTSGTRSEVRVESLQPGWV